MPPWCPSAQHLGCTHSACSWPSSAPARDVLEIDTGGNNSVFRWCFSKVQVADRLNIIYTLKNISQTVWKHFWCNWLFESWAETTKIILYKYILYVWRFCFCLKSTLLKVLSYYSINVIINFIFLFFNFVMICIITLKRQQQKSTDTWVLFSIYIEWNRPSRTISVNEKKKKIGHREGESTTGINCIQPFMITLLK